MEIAKGVFFFFFCLEKVRVMFFVLGDMNGFLGRVSYPFFLIFFFGSL